MDIFLGMDVAWENCRSDIISKLSVREIHVSIPRNVSSRFCFSHLASPLDQSLLEQDKVVRLSQPVMHKSSWQR